MRGCATGGMGQMLSVFLFVAFTSASGQLTTPSDAQNSTVRAAVVPGSLATPQTNIVQPAKPITPELRGDIFMARKEYRDAIDQYERCSQDSAVIANKIGIGYHQLLDLQDARKYYQRAIRLDPRYSEAVNNLGTIYYSGKNFRRAIGQYKKALRLAPDSATVYSNLGSAYFSRHDFKKAVAAYQQALVLDPDVLEHHSSHGILLQEQSVEDKAKFHYYMARVYAKQGMNDRALQNIRKAIEEGFKDRDKFRKEPEFAGLRGNEEFEQLMKLEPRAL